MSSSLPLKYCIESPNKNIEEILGFKNQYDDHNKNHVDSNSTLLEFIIPLEVLFTRINLDQPETTRSIASRWTDQVTYMSEETQIVI